MDGFSLLLRHFPPTIAFNATTYPTTYQIMKRFLSSLVIALLAIAIAPIQALAADTATTGAWTWTDISSYASNRTNRPIWAMAHTNSGWFYTDGQNLWNSGQIYRFDGSTNVTVTNDVRSAGLDRVDDIVSDGADTVLFLQDVVRMDNQFRIVVNKNGTYYNATDVVRGMLNSDEGISSISGRNGTWYFVTTESRLFRWYANSNAPVQITIPSGIRNYSFPTEQSMVYSVGQIAFHGMKIVPINSSEWLLMAQAGGNWLTYKYDGSTFTDITSTVFPNTRGTDVLFSNGTTAVFGQGSYSYQNGILAQYNGSNLYQASANSSIFSASISAAAWDGTSWVLISSNKEIARMMPYTSTLENIGKSRDYFITASGDANGRLLLGGTVSQIGTTGPTNPLTAKLVMITETGTSNSTANTTTDGSTGINAWDWIDPNTNSLGANAQTTYHVGSQDADGIKKVEIYVNGSIKRTCDLGNATNNTDCSYTIYANDYSVGSNVFVNAKVTDAKDQSIWTSGKTIYRSSDNTTGTTDSTSNNSVWTWLDPNDTYLYSDESVTYYVGAWDKDGIAQITIMANGSSIRSCNFYGSKNNSECSQTVYADDYSSNSTISLRARVVDSKGNETWTNLTEIYRRSGNSTNNNTNTTSYNGSIWTWLDGKTSSLNPDENTVFNAGAQDSDGINRVILSVNGTDKKTCNYGASTSNVECAYTVYANDYSANTTLTLRARYVDADGNTVWSTERDIYRNAGSSTSGNTTSNSDAIHQWEWVEPSNADLEIQKTAAYHADAWSASAIKSIALYVNGSVVKTCTFTRSVVNRDCTTSIVGRNYKQGSSVYMNALITDFDGAQAWTSGKTLNIIADSTSSTNNNPNGWVSATTNRESGFTAGQSITISVSSDDTDGVARTEIYINGVKNTTCNNSKTCTATVMPPSTGNYFNYAGTMVDKYGTVVTTGYKQIIRK